MADLKLKQASAVLGVPPKELQNLVQLRVLKPKRRKGLNWFDRSALLKAKVALYLKQSLGASTSYVGMFTDAISRIPDFESGTRERVLLRSRPWKGKPAIEIIIPLRSLATELAERLPLGSSVTDLPRGRKRPGWKKEFLTTLQRAAEDLGDPSEDGIVQAVKRYRQELKTRPEIAVVAETEKATA
jgi:hypothetical protein